jgi:hypothetical protein
MSALLLPLIAWRQATATRWLTSFPAAPDLRFIALAYAAVMLEETLVGTLAALLAEGDPSVWLDRVRQFITLNLFVFTGPILALAAYVRLTTPHRWELLVIAGGWGLFAESVLQRLVAAPLLAGLLIWPTIVVYALIFLPATLSASPARGTRNPPLLLRARADMGLGLRHRPAHRHPRRTPARPDARPLPSLPLHDLFAQPLGRKIWPD